MSMRVTFEENVKNIVSQKKVPVGENIPLGLNEDHILRLKAELAKEKDRRKNNQNLAQLFLGYVCLCFLAWRFNDLSAFFGFGSLVGGNELLTFKTFGLEATHRFPLHRDAHQESAEMVLVSAGMRRSYLVVPSFSVGLYLSEEKMQELSKAKSLSVLSSYPPELDDIHQAKDSRSDKSARDGLFLALKIDFALPESAQALGNMFSSALAGARDAEYRRALEYFSAALLRQVGANGMRKKDTLVFLFQGHDWLGVAANGQMPDYVQNAHLRRRLLNAFAGENPIASELPEVLRINYL